MLRNHLYRADYYARAPGVNRVNLAQMTTAPIYLKLGSQGLLVSDLQLKLKALGYYAGDVDGDFGPKTRAAVLAFQVAYDELLDDGVAGPLTRAKLDQAAAVRPAARAPVVAKYVPAPAYVFAAFLRFVAAIAGKVKYGPGRGLFVGDKYVVTHGPGSLGAKAWKSATGSTFPSFHCTSFLNTFMSWITGRLGLFTHAGNIPSMFDLFDHDSSPVTQAGVGTWRGFADETTPIAPDGSTAKRRPGFTREMDVREILARARAGTLPTFVAFAQSTLIGGVWKWWHHVGLFVSWEGKLYRIAADGYYSAAGGWSGDVMRYVEITDANAAYFDACVYRCYSVDVYADARDLAEVVLES